VADLFLPQGQVAGHRYPLLVWLSDQDARGGSFDLGRVMARTSLRNFVAVQPAAAGDPARAVWRAVERVSGEVACHPQRIYLVGVNSGGTDAFRLGCRHADAFAGAASLGGPFPLDEGAFARLDAVRRLPMLLCCHRDADAATARGLDRTLRLFHAAGSTLAVRIYPDPDPLSAAVLADLNRWVMESVCGAGSPAAAVCSP